MGSSPIVSTNQIAVSELAQAKQQVERRLILHVGDATLPHGEPGEHGLVERSPCPFRLCLRSRVSRTDLAPGISRVNSGLLQSRGGPDRKALSPRHRLTVLAGHHVS